LSLPCAHFTGNPLSAEEPSPPGPRNCDQSPAANGPMRMSETQSAHSCGRVS